MKPMGGVDAASRTAREAGLAHAHRDGGDPRPADARPISPKPWTLEDLEAKDQVLMTGSELGLGW